MKVLVAMSGGVDSSATAALLVDEGHDVTGVHLKMADTPSGLPGKGCCTLDDARDARRVADRLGIPFYVWDLAEPFAERVVDDFVAEYAAGRTPNPVHPLQRARQVHRAARPRPCGRASTPSRPATTCDCDRRRGGRTGMHAGADPGKDQTYVLYMATQEQLAHTLWPAGEQTKADLRAWRPNADCSPPPSPTATTSASSPPATSARSSGLGSGAARGLRRPGRRDDRRARRRLPVHRRPAPRPRPRRLRRAAVRDRIVGDDVHVGPRSALEVTGLEADRVSWVAGAPPVAGSDRRRRSATAGRRCPASSTTSATERSGSPSPGSCRRRRPGQAVVLYRGEECLGGGTIS
jgi:tRNA-uridine 2-sulfurtransferase